MNAPLPDSIRQALEAVTLDDKYTLREGRAFMSGIQALVRLPMLQRQRDLAAGLNTAGFISGYRGSPLGGYDQSLWAAKKHLAAQHIVFQPGVNEELAATAVWGTQQLEFDAAMRRGAGHVGMLEHVRAAVHARALAIPDAEHAVELLVGRVELQLLRAPQRRGDRKSVV